MSDSPPSLASKPAALTRALCIGAAVFAGLTALEAGPAWLAPSAAVLAALLSLISADLGAMTAVLVLSVPVLAVSPVLGIAFAVIGVAGVRYLGTEDGHGFLVTAAALPGAIFGPAWAAPVLAGTILGAGEGALTAFFACLAVQAIGIVFGLPSIGPVFTGGAASPLVDTSLMPDSLLAVSWVSESLRSIDATAVNTVVDTLTSIEHPLVLLAQPLLWAAGAYVAGRLACAGRTKRSLPLAVAGSVVGVLLMAAGARFMLPMLGAELTGDIPAAVTSLAAVAVVAVVFERFYVVERGSSASTTGATIADEDADVDELLRLISTAEERLATEHTSVRTVMITDMKAFSNMTEEDGSVLTAKAIQRHRDLLLPIIERHGGCGKSTGGDGLIAAFTAPDAAVLAAVDMQRELERHNASHADRRPLSVRIGLATGEVVLDKRGRPFIGAAINVAARVMNLADGGQSFAADSVTSAAGGVAEFRPLGQYRLKNISEPIDVFEVAWNDSAAEAV